MTHPQLTFINLPGPPSNPDTPSEIPGTPTSTTTSLSALSTTAIKDGHRGHAMPTTNHRGGHQQHTSQGSLEAERADRISRLAGLSSVSQQMRHSGSQANPSPQTTPTSTGFPGPLQPRAVAPQIMGAPAYFDSNGQPVAVTKLSTVGTASATDSIGGRTTTDLSGTGPDESAERDIDIMSTDTNFRETEMDSASGYMGTGAPNDEATMEEDGSRSVGGFDDRMSDDGSASLVGFGEGANSTMSGPIYVRSRPLPGVGLERSSSGLSESAILARRERYADREAGDTPVSSTAAMERREARMLDGVAPDGVPSGSGTADEETFVDTTINGPVPAGGPVQPGQNSALRETQQNYTRQQASTAREAAERVMRDRGFDNGRLIGNPALGSPSKTTEPKLGRFAFEDQK